MPALTFGLPSRKPTTKSAAPTTVPSAVGQGPAPGGGQFSATSGDVGFNLTRHGLGNVSSSMNMPEGWSPGKLQDILRWKMKMAEDLQRAQIEAMRSGMRQQGVGGGGGGAPGNAWKEQELRNALMSQQLQDARAKSGMINQVATGKVNDWASWDRDARARAALGAMLGGGGSANIIPGPQGMDQAQVMKLLQSVIGQLTPDPNSEATTDEKGAPTGYRMPGLGRTFLGNSPLPSNALSRKTGGGIPKDGWYYLHAQEEVVPAPKTLRDMMMGKMVRNPAPKGSPPSRNPHSRESFETGTRSLWDVIKQLTSAEPMPSDEEALQMWLGQKDEESDTTDPRLLTDPQLSKEYNIPSGPGERPAPDPEVQAMELRRRNVADPDVDMRTAMASMAQERQRFGQGASDGRKMDQRPSESGIEGLSISEEPLSERRQTATLGGQALYNRPEAPAGQTSVKKYTLDQTPRTDQERRAREAETLQRELDSQRAEVDRLNEAAYSHSQMASKLLDYAAQNQGSSIYESLRQQASDRLALAQQMERMAAQQAKMLDAKASKLGELQTNLAVAQIEAGGRVGAAEAEARGREAVSGQQGQQQILNSLRQLATAFSGIEGGDPDTQEQMIQQMMQLFLMLGGLQEAFGGGLPNG